MTQELMKEMMTKMEKTPMVTPKLRLLLKESKRSNSNN